MPLIYEGRCSACDAVTGWTSDGYAAVYVEEPATVYPHPDDPHLVIIPHPGGSRILDEISRTHGSVEWGGRLVHVRTVFCTGCGCQFEVRRLTAGLTAFGCGGCLGVLVLAAAAGLGVGRVVGGWVGYAAGWATFTLLVAVAERAVRRFVRWRYAERATRVDTPACCPSCGGAETACPSSLRQPIPCVACGQRTVRFHVVADS